MFHYRTSRSTKACTQNTKHTQTHTNIGTHPDNCFRRTTKTFPFFQQTRLSTGGQIWSSVCGLSTKAERGALQFKAIMWIVFHMKNGMSQKFCDKWQSGQCLEFHRGMQHNLIKRGLERKSVTWRLAGGLTLDESGNSLSHCCQHFLMWTLRLIGGPGQVFPQTFPACMSATPNQPLSQC